MNIAMIFPGYGSQYVGMAKELYDESRLIQEYFEEASTCLSMNFVRLCFASSEQELKILSNAYVSLFLVSASIVGLLKEKGIVPNIVAGYGIGNYSALFGVQSLTLPDGLYFLSKYAQFYQDTLNSLNVRSLLVSNISVAKLKKICSAAEEVFLSIYHKDNEAVIAGDDAEIDTLEDYLDDLDADLEEYPVDAGLYSPLMIPVVDQLKIYLEKIDIRDTQIPVLSTMDGKEITKGRLIQDRVMKQIVSPIRWDKVMDRISQANLIIEIGPGASLRNLMQSVYPHKKIISINKPADVAGLADLIEQQRLL